MGNEQKWMQDLVMGELRQTSKNAFLSSILGMLYREFNMASISDLIFLLPLHGRITFSAFQRISRIDYLLMAAILGRKCDSSYQREKLKCSLGTSLPLLKQYTSDTTQLVEDDSIRKPEGSEKKYLPRSERILIEETLVVTVHAFIMLSVATMSGVVDIGPRAYLAIMSALEMSSAEIMEYNAQQGIEKRRG